MTVVTPGNEADMDATTMTNRRTRMKMMVRMVRHVCCPCCSVLTVLAAMVDVDEEESHLKNIVDLDGLLIKDILDVNITAEVIPRDAFEDAEPDDEVRLAIIRPFLNAEQHPTLGIRGIHCQFIASLIS